MNIALRAHIAMRGALCCILSATLITAGGPAFARDQNVDKVKTALSRIGTGEKAHVSVKLKSGTVLKGNINALDEEDFTVISEVGSQKVMYSDVEKVKRPGLHPLITVAIIAGIVIGIAAGLLYASCGSGGCH